MAKKKIIISLLFVLIIGFGLIKIFLTQEKKAFFSANKPSQLKKPNKTSFSSPVSQPLLPSLTLSLIFSPHHWWSKNLPSDQTITIITTGDVIPARSVNYKMIKYNNFHYPLEKTADFLKSADITLINLEAPLIKNCPVTNQGMVFCGNQRFVNGLKIAGIDIANLANNHTLNWGVEGIKQTVDLLEQNKILTCGFPQAKPAIKTKNNFKVGFLGWNLLAKSNSAKILTTIRQAKKNVDLLVVSFHWGQEYTSFPSQSQRKLAHQAIEAGADLIAGNHPHWIQPIEIYQGKLIIYAHGNFVFDQEWSQETKIGVVGRHLFYQKKLVDSQFFPVIIQDYSQPRWLKGKEKEKIIEKLKTISFQLKTSPF